MKRIVYLTFYFKPDLSAGSFRNSSLVIELSRQAKLKNIFIDLYTTSPNRYSTFKSKALEYEELDNLRIHRIQLPSYKSSMIYQVLSFSKFYWKVIKMNKGKKIDLVFASSSRLFTAFLGFVLAKKSNSLLYLDIRDIFIDGVNDILKLRILKTIVIPILRYVEKKTYNYATHINLISEGFKEYLLNFKCNNFSFFTNGIDEEFINSNNTFIKTIKKENKLIVYAGNIGEGQGLHKIIPKAAKLLGERFTFLIIGDGGQKNLLEMEINKLNVKNVILKNPIPRQKLIEVYNSADYLFLHLNNAFAGKKVLPSKIFELSTYTKNILAGVNGYAAKFIKKEVSDCFVFESCDANKLVKHLLFHKQKNIIKRDTFINKFKRSKINQEFSISILNYLK